MRGDLERRRTILRRVALAVCYIAVLVYTGTLFGVTVAANVIPMHLLALGLIARLLLRAAARPGLLVPRGLAGWLAAGALASAALASALGVRPRESAFGLVELVAWVGLVDLVAEVGRDAEGRRRAAGLAGLGLAAACAAAAFDLATVFCESGAAAARAAPDGQGNLLTFLRAGSDGVRTLLPLSLPFGHRNFLGAHAALVLPIVIGLAWSAPGRRARRAWGSVAIVGLAALGCSQSLLGFIGTVAGGGLAALTILASRLDPLRRARLRAAAPVVLAGMVALSAAGAIGFALTIRAERNTDTDLALRVPERAYTMPILGQAARLYRNLTGHLDEGARARPLYWRAALESVSVERPLLGFGVRSAPFVWGERRIQHPAYETHPSELDDLHNGAVHVLFELGLLGGGLTIAAVVAFLALAFRQAIAPSPPLDEPDRGLSVGIAAGLGGFATALVGGYVVNIESVALALGVAVGLVVGAARGVSPRPRGEAGGAPPRIGALGLVIACMFLSGAVVIVGLADAAHWQHDVAYADWMRIQSLTDARSGKTREDLKRRGLDDGPVVKAQVALRDEAIERERRAEGLDPHGGFYASELAILYEEEVRDPHFSPETHATALQMAVEASRRAVEQGPTLDVILHHGTLLLQAGKSTEAIPVLRRAVADHAYSQFTHFYLALACRDASLHTSDKGLARRLADEAARELGDAILLEPQLVYAVAWYGEPSHAIYLDAIGRARKLIGGIDGRRMRKVSPELVDERLAGAPDLMSFAVGRRTTSYLASVDDINHPETRALFLFRRRGIPMHVLPIELISDFRPNLPSRSIVGKMELDLPAVRTPDLLRDGPPILLDGGKSRAEAPRGAPSAVTATGR